MEANIAAVNVSNMVNTDRSSTRDCNASNSPRPTTGRLRIRLVLGCLMCSTFAQATQSTYLLAAIPHMEKDLGVSFREAFGMTAVFLSGLTLAQIVGHDLTRIIGRLPVFVFAAILLTAGTILGALARSVEVFVAGRILQGVGAGIAEPVKAHIVIVVLDTSTARLSKMAVFVDYSWMAGVAVGPILGMCLETTRLGWQSSFWLVVPLMVLSGVVMPFLLSAETEEEKAVAKASAKKVNPVSQGGLLAATACVFSGLTYAGSSREWSSPLVFGWLTASLACCLLLVVSDKFAPWWEPLFRKSAFNASTYLRLADVFLNSCLTWILLYFLSLYILRQKNAAPLEIALHTVSVTLTAAVTAMVTGFRVSRFCHDRAPALAGWICVIGTFAMLCLLGTTETDATLVGMGLFGGFGIGASSSNPFAHHMEAFAENDQTHKIRVTWQVRAAGQTFGLLIGSAVFGNEIHRREISSVLNELTELVPGRDHPDSFVNIAILDSLRLVWMIALASASLGFILCCVSLCEKSGTNGESRNESNGRGEINEEASIELGHMPRRQAQDNPFANSEEDASETGTLAVSFVEIVEPPEVEEDPEGAENPKVGGDPNVPPTIRCVPREEYDLNPWTESIPEPRQFV